MLNRRYSLNNSEIFEVVKKGRSLTGNGFYVKFVYGDDFKFSFSVSTKVSKKAVIRNRIKRKFRAAVFNLLGENTLKEGIYVFVVKDVKFYKTKSNIISEEIKKTLTHG